MSNTDTGKLYPTQEQNSNTRLNESADDDTHHQHATGKEGRTARIRELNDQLRTQGRGGMIVMTNGVAALGLAPVNSIFKAIAAFSTFTPDNDPWAEHDCGVMEVDGHRLIWKIDYYDRSRTCHSPDPADPKVTVRVLTVMLAEEY